MADMAWARLGARESKSEGNRKQAENGEKGGRENKGEKKDNRCSIGHTRASAARRSTKASVTSAPIMPTL